MDDRDWVGEARAEREKISGEFRRALEEWPANVHQVLFHLQHQVLPLVVQLEQQRDAARAEAERLKSGECELKCSMALIEEIERVTKERDAVRADLDTCQGLLMKAGKELAARRVELKEQKERADALCEAYQGQINVNNNQKATLAATRKALERFVLAAESEDELLSNSADIWDAYEAARVVLGNPVKNYPGGYYDDHFHLYEWKEGDHCDTCEDWKADQKAKEEELAQPVAEAT